MQTAISAIFVFLLVVFIHELGHFSVAKFVGIKVNEFAIGMGPKLIQTSKGETKYTLRALPIGGYVKMEGEEESSSDPRSFNNASPWGRIAVLFAGAFMNFVLAFVVLSIVAFSAGTPTTTIEQTDKDSPARLSGILPRDRITSINGIDIFEWDDISEVIGNSNPDESIVINLLRDGTEETITVNPITKDGRVIIGIFPLYEKSAGNAIKEGFKTTVGFIGIMFDFIKMIFQGKVSTNDLSGPVGVVREIGNAASLGTSSLLFLLGFISVNLGFFNLLPVPALDGSKILFTLVEIIRGKPINPEKENMIHLVGFVLLLSLMLVVTYKDIMRINLF